MRALFSPEISHAVAVKGLRGRMDRKLQSEIARVVVLRGIALSVLLCKLTKGLIVFALADSETVDP